MHLAPDIYYSTLRRLGQRLSYEEEDTCMRYEEEDTCRYLVELVRDYHGDELVGDALVGIGS